MLNRGKERHRFRLIFSWSNKTLNMMDSSVLTRIKSSCTMLEKMEIQDKFGPLPRIHILMRLLYKCAPMTLESWLWEFLDQVKIRSAKWYHTIVMMDQIYKLFSWTLFLISTTKILSDVMITTCLSLIQKEKFIYLSTLVHFQFG